ncbi:MAG: COX15/CtaA family protein [Thermoleophilia bacterium]
MSGSSAVARRLPSGLLSALAEPARFRVLALVNAFLLWVILPSGGLVRSAARGWDALDWPTCNGGVVPARNYHSVIEYTNRLVSAGVIVVSILAWVVARHVAPRGAKIRGLALAAALMSVGQIPLGGITVLSGLHPAMVGSHFVLSLAAVGAAVLLVLVTIDRQRGVSRAWDSRRGPFATVTAAALLAVVTTGVFVTAAGPHSGDTKHMTRFGDLQTTAWLHVRAVGLLVVLMLVLALWVRRERSSDPAVNRLVAWFLPLLALQIFIGEYQYRHGLPWQVIVGHVGVGGLVWCVGLATAWCIARPTPR